MKTTAPVLRGLNCIPLGIIFLVLSITGKAQTYTTIANGAWSSAATWQGGVIPNANNIPISAVVNIRHSITYSGGDIMNFGIINISNPAGLSPRLSVASGVNFENKPGSKMYITGGEYRQFRFVGGGEMGVRQTGTFKNVGAYVAIRNSFVEVAQGWSNESTGLVVFKNSSLVAGGSYEIKSSSTDSLINTSVSIGWHSAGDFIANGTSVYFQSFRVEVASLAGNFRLDNGIANGTINYISLKNHYSGILGIGRIYASASITTTGLTVDAYCMSLPLNYQSNGKFSGAQTLNCSLNYFPATIFGATSTAAFNFSTIPALIAGTDLQVGATYKYEGVKPGVDAIVKIDSLIGGATLSLFDDNSAAYPEGFQPRIISGSAVGQSYAVFNFNYKITGTTIDHNLDTFSLTALDIDGSSSLREFDQISLGVGSTAGYIVGNPAIALAQVSPGTFRAINADFLDKPGIDTAAKENMFTVTNTDVSSFTLKMGMVTTQSQQSTRLYSMYMKGFVYPSPAQTLPVKMESFTATLSSNGNNADLRWTTASEINVSHFVIERSLDGTNYSDAGLVFAYGNAGSKTNYNYSDNLNKILSGIIYYRIRTVDIDGKEKYSETRIIRIGGLSDKNITILTYPNPASNELRITIPASWQNKKVTYELFNSNGQVAKKSEATHSSQTETINVNSLSPGLYIIKVSCGGETVQQKIIKN